MKILALDIGSSSVKAGLWNGGALGSPRRVVFPTRFDGPRVEIDAAEILKAVRHAGAQALDGLKQIDAVAFCTFSSGVIVADMQDKPLTPVITHADRRSGGTALELVKRRSKAWWLSRTGNLPYAGGIGSSTLAWLRRNTPAIFRKPHRVGQISSFVGSFLTGGGADWLIDPSQACFLGLYDIRRDRWDAEICKVVGVSMEALPAIRWADQRMGGLGAAAARHWGIAAGTPVVGGFVDTSAAVIQTPMHAGQLSHNAGSTDVLALCVDRAHPAEGILTRPVGVSGRWRGKKSAAPPWLAVRTMASAGSAMEWTRKTLFPNLSDGQWRGVVERTCKGLDPKETGGVKCLPTFVGERASLTQPQGATFSEVRLETDGNDMLQAVLRALVLQSAENYERLKAIHAAARTVYSMGGASAVGDAMHAAWPGRHTFRHLTGDSLQGLVMLAQRATG